MNFPHQKLNYILHPIKSKQRKCDWISFIQGLSSDHPFTLTKRQSLLLNLPLCASFLLLKHFETFCGYTGRPSQGIKE